MNKNILITGGAGFIGSHLTKRLLKDDWNVLIIDNLSTGLKSNVPQEAEFLYLDITEENFVDQLPRKNFDVVLLSTNI